MAWASETSKLPPTRPYPLIFPKQFYQLGIKHSDIWAYGGHSCLKHHRPPNCLSSLYLKPLFLCLIHNLLSCPHYFIKVCINLLVVLNKLLRMNIKPASNHQSQQSMINWAGRHKKPKKLFLNCKYAMEVEKNDWGPLIYSLCQKW